MVMERILLIEKHLARLRPLSELTRGKFALPDNFDIASHNLRCALEAVFDISGHILSRIPGVSFEGYKNMALELGRNKIVPMDFAEKNLYEMAGYRNRLTHFYFEIAPEELYGIIKNDLGDFEKFLQYIKKVLK